MKEIEIINKFKTSYIKNMKLYSDYNDSLFKELDFNSWNKTLIERSKAIRAMFKENEENISLIHKILDGKITEEVAKALFLAIKDFKSEEIHDASLFIEIINKLIEYYEKNTNYDVLISLYNIGALEEMEFFLRMDTHEITYDPVVKYMKAIALKDKYKELNANSRRSIFISYYNMLGPIPDLLPEYRKKLLHYYKEAIDFYNSDTVQSIDKDNEDIKEELYYLKDILITGFYYFINENKELKDEYFNLIIDILKTSDVDEMQVKLIKLVMEYNDGKIKVNSLLNKLYNLFYEYYGDDLKYDGTDDNINQYCNCNDIAATMMIILKDIDIPDDEKYEYLSKLSHSLLNYIDSVPYKDLTSYFDEKAADLFRELMPFCKNMAQKDDLLNKLILRRQPMTYIHSIMVEKISVAIAKEVLKKNRNIFSDLINIGYDTDDKIIEYISNAAFYHDLGKCLTVGVINLQNRNLTDFEFKYIKMHPKKCKELLGEDVSFLEYYDVMIGHHKSYDGKSGYPEDFDNLTSPYKSAIDLISIADSTDAATDILGRNYTEGKDFYHLLAELNEGKNTRYNPYIVDIINESDELKEFLDNITSKKRAEVYYDVYKKILSERK